MVNYATVDTDDLLVVNVQTKDHHYDVHIQMGDITVLPCGHRTKYRTEKSQKGTGIKHIDVMMKP